MSQFKKWMVILSVVFLLSSYLIPSNINVTVKISFDEPKEKIVLGKLGAFPMWIEPTIGPCEHEKPKNHYVIRVKEVKVERKKKVKLSKFERREAYVDEYKDVAIEEMEKYGIPASISLAQGLLESGQGESYLATKAKNHFGIKFYNKKRIPEGIKPLLDGKYYKNRHDDCCTKSTRHLCKDTDKFVHFKNIWASWRYHSYVLLRYSRVKKLIKAKNKNYKTWAYAVKKSGYATSPTYAPDLIKLIKKHKLYKYDK